MKVFFSQRHTVNFFARYPFLVPLVAILIGEILKFAVTSHKEQKFNWKNFARPGGMPSGHATLASSVAMTALLLRGIHSVEFAISGVFAVIVMYDSVKLRWEAGRHAKVLNYLLGQKKLEERLGHTFLEMLTGIFLGVAISFLLLAA